MAHGSVHVSRQEAAIGVVAHDAQQRVRAHDPPSRKGRRAVRLAWSSWSSTVRPFWHGAPILAGARSVRHEGGIDVGNELCALLLREHTRSCLPDLLVATVAAKERGTDGRVGGSCG